MRNMLLTNNNIVAITSLLYPDLWENRYRTLFLEAYRDPHPHAYPAHYDINNPYIILTASLLARKLNMHGHIHVYNNYAN